MRNVFKIGLVILAGILLQTTQAAESKLIVTLPTKTASVVPIGFASIGGMVGGSSGVVAGLVTGWTHDAVAEHAAPSVPEENIRLMYYQASWLGCGGGNSDIKESNIHAKIEPNTWYLLTTLDNGEFEINPVPESFLDTIEDHKCFFSAEKSRYKLRAKPRDAKKQQEQRRAMQFAWPAHGRAEMPEGSNQVNIHVAPNTPVAASAEGKIMMVKNGQIVIKHENGYLTHYSRLQNITVNANETVPQGMIIGASPSDNPFFTFGVFINGKFVPPGPLMGSAPAPELAARAEPTNPVNPAATPLEAPIATEQTVRAEEAK